MNTNEQSGLSNFLTKQYGKVLPDAEISEYKERLVKFFSILIEIDQRNKRKSNEAKNI